MGDADEEESAAAWIEKNRRVVEERRKAEERVTILIFNFYVITVKEMYSVSISNIYDISDIVGKDNGRNG